MIITQTPFRMSFFGGGFLLFYVPLEKQDDVMNALKDQMYVPFKFENDGTKIIYYSAEDYK